ncbi:MAG: sugar ABC transporter permease [Clostridia bacterium]|nr:sugar ABC transporter permease [Clostridia bacterium]
MEQKATALTENEALTVRARKRRWKKWTGNDFVLVGMASLSVLFLAVFSYATLYGLVLAFVDGDGYMDIMRAIRVAEWCGLDKFKLFITDPDFGNIMFNTLGLNILQLFINFPLPIAFAIFTAELISDRFKKTVQTVTFFPHFLSWAIFGGIFVGLLDYDMGIVNTLFYDLGIVKEKVDILGEPRFFWPIIIITSLIKGMGWGSIIYVAAIASIPQEMYEAAKIDGANRYHKIVYITLPSIAPTITLFFILSVSGILNNGIEHLWVFQNVNNIERSEVLDTYLYKNGFPQWNYSYATAIGLMKSVVALVLLIISNFVCKKVTGKGIY